MLPKAYYAAVQLKELCELFPEIQIRFSECVG